MTQPVKQSAKLPVIDNTGIDIAMKRVQRLPVWLEAQPPLAQWYASALGQSILHDLERCLALTLADVFGYQGVQIGNPAPGHNLLDHAGLHRRLVIDSPGRPADINADVLHLPIASDTLKSVVFFHTLDFCDHPHQAMREADRVLMEDGQLIIVGFNPFSFFGARHLLSGWRQRAPWCGRFYSRTRVTDWLSVLDYRVLHSEAMFIRPPINSQRLLTRLRSVERLQPWLGMLGGVYVIKARKQTLPMTLARRQWRRQSNRISVGSFARTGNASSRQTASVSRIGKDEGRNDR